MGGEVLEGNVLLNFVKESNDQCVESTTLCVSHARSPNRCYRSVTCSTQRALQQLVSSLPSCEDSCPARLSDVVVAVRDRQPYVFRKEEDAAAGPTTPLLISPTTQIIRNNLIYNIVSASLAGRFESLELNRTLRPAELPRAVLRLHRDRL